MKKYAPYILILIALVGLLSPVADVNAQEPGAETVTITRNKTQAEKDACGTARSSDACRNQTITEQVPANQIPPGTITRSKTQAEKAQCAGQFATQCQNQTVAVGGATGGATTT